MKKRILALALAGTTAFSVFSMGVSALEIDEHVTDEVLYAASLTTADGKLFVDGVEIDKTNYGKYTWFGTEDADEAIAEGVSAKTIYAYDYVPYHNIEAVEDFEDALEEAFTEGKTADLVDILENGLAFDYASDFRDDLMDAWDDFVDGVVAKSDLVVEDEYDYYFDELLDLIAKVNKSDVYASSTRISIMEVYNAYIEEMELKDGDTVIEKIDALVETLTTRVEDDFASSRKYDAYTKALDKALEKYADADTVTEYNAVLKALEDVADLPYAAKLDVADAEAVLKALFADGKYTKPAYVGGIYTAADYDNVKEDLEDGDPYDVFVDAYATVVDLLDGNAKTAYQSDLNTAVADLEDAIAALEVINVAEDWEIARLDYYYGLASAKVEEDYTVATWKKLTKAMEVAEDLLNSDAPGAKAVEDAGEDLNAKVAALKKATVSTGDWTALKAADKAADKLLATLKKEGAGSMAQYVALEKAIAKSDAMIDAGKAAAYNSKVAKMIADLEAAMNYSETVMGWVKTDAGWAYGTADGYVQNGWYKVKDNWCYFENGVALANTWKNLDGTWYYLNSYCFAARGWAKVDGKWYFFNDGCAMLANTTVDGYVLSASGAMVE